MITDQAEWACGRSRLTSTLSPDVRSAARLPPVGTLAARLTFPSCWDGRSLGSDDHRSHVTEAVAGGCPSSHPVEITEVAFAIHSTVNGDIADRLSLASGELASAHADFVSGWEPGRLAREIGACLHRNLVCNVPDDL